MKNRFFWRCGGLLLCLHLLALAARAQSPSLTLAATITAAVPVQIESTATDAAGNVYVTGSFFGTTTFGSLSLTSLGYRDMFVAKWSPVSRTFVWVKQATGTTYVEPKKLVVSGSSLYFAGQFYYSATFGNTRLTTAGTQAGLSGSDSDVFVARLVDNGTTATWAWAQRAGGTSDDQPSGVAVQGTTVYATGVFRGTATFGAATLTSTGPTAGFITKLTDAGTTATFNWTAAVNGADGASISCLNGAGSALYVAGYAPAQATLGTTALPAAGVGTGFVARLADAGSTAGITWFTRLGGLIGGVGHIVGSSSSVYIAGTFDSATFGSTTLTATPPLSPTGSLYPDLFVAKLTDSGSSGSIAWAIQAGGPGEDAPMGLAARGNRLYIAGYAVGSSTFGTATLTGTGSPNGFLACVTDNGGSAAFSSAHLLGGTGANLAYSVCTAGTTVYAAGFVTPPSTIGSTPVTAPAGTDRVCYLAALTDPLLTSTPAQRPAFSAYPNPARTSVTVELPAQAGPTTLALLDELGRVVRTATVTVPVGGLRQEVPIAVLPPGIYTLRVAIGTVATTQLLTVE